MKKNYEEKFIPTTDEWVALYSTYGSQIVRALWQSGNKQDCEDALQFAMIKIMGLDAKHHLEKPLQPKTEGEWVCFIQLQARAFLGHLHEHEAKWGWAGNSYKELFEVYQTALSDRTLTGRARDDRLRNIRRQLKYLLEAERVRNVDVWSPVERLEADVRRLAVREMIDIVCSEYRVSDRDREVYVRAVLDGEDAQCIADDLLDGARGSLYTIVCRVNKKLLKYGRAAFARALVRADAKLWRMGA